MSAGSGVNDAHYKGLMKKHGCLVHIKSATEPNTQNLQYHLDIYNFYGEHNILISHLCAENKFFMEVIDSQMSMHERAKCLQL